MDSDESLAERLYEESDRETPVLERLRPRQDWVKFPSPVARQLRALTPLDQRARVLFSGPSGTGKTVAAEMLAGDLELDLYRIDLAAVISKYIGETEKNLGELITNVREKAPVVLLLTHVEALAQAGLTFDDLLRKVERFPGPVVISGEGLSDGRSDGEVEEWGTLVDFS